MRDTYLTGSTGLADLVASRLCHDLVNPLGAIGNGVELIEMTGKADGPEMDLIRDAVKAAEARIRLFRLAFGGASEGQSTSAREATIAVESYFNQSRVEIDWTATADAPRLDIKLGFLMVLCAETALPMGGTLRAGPDAQGIWTLEATGPRLQIDEDLWSILRFGAAEIARPLKPADAQFPLLQSVVDALGRSVNYVVDGDVLRMSIS